MDDPVVARVSAVTPSSFAVDALLADVAELVGAESPSSDVDACADAARVLAASAARRLPTASVTVVEREGRPHVVVRTGGAPRVLLLGHLDTVWPLGTLAARPFTVAGGVVRGPGVFDMKAGLVLALHAVAALGAPEGVALLATSDEEIGSATSADLLRELAAEAGSVLVLEPPVDGPAGAVKIARKGVGFYRVTCAGREAHAGLNPGDGVNALLELAHQLPRLAALADESTGTTVTPTVAGAGTAVNVVPAQAWADVDVRVAAPGEDGRIDAALRALAPVLAGATVTVTGGINRPPLPPAATAELFALAGEVAASLGMPAPAGASVGGGSDGNLVAPLGVRVLDGLGPPGGGAHTQNEHVLVDGLAPRAALVAGLVARLVG